jgi:hypothetical protein
MLIIPTGFRTLDFGNEKKLEAYGKSILALSRSFRRAGNHRREEDVC